LIQNHRQSGSRIGLGVSEVLIERIDFNVEGDDHSFKEYMVFAVSGIFYFDEEETEHVGEGSLVDAIKQKFFFPPMGGPVANNFSSYLIKECFFLIFLALLQIRFI
jgi:hypothetical protein